LHAPVRVCYIFRTVNFFRNKRVGGLRHITKRGHRLRNVAIAVGMLALSFFVWVFRPYEKSDISQVDPRFRDFEEPCTAVVIIWYGDGGSVSFRLSDRTGRVFAFCLPAPLDEPHWGMHEKLFIGAEYDTDPGASEVLNPYHTKLRLAELLRSMPIADPEESLERDDVVFLLSWRLRDLWRLVREDYLSGIHKGNDDKRLDGFNELSPRPMEEILSNE
jgi:hypothetical protein